MDTYRLIRKFKEMIVTLEDYLTDPVYDDFVSFEQRKLRKLYTRLRNANLHIEDDWLERFREVVGREMLFGRTSIEQ